MLRGDFIEVWNYWDFYLFKFIFLKELRNRLRKIASQITSISFGAIFWLLIQGSRINRRNWIEMSTNWINLRNFSFCLFCDKWNTTIMQWTKKILKKSILSKNNLGHLLEVFLRRVSKKRYRIFRFCVHFTNQEGDFYGVFPFLVPDVSEK